MHESCDSSQDVSQLREQLIQDVSLVLTKMNYHPLYNNHSIKLNDSSRNDKDHEKNHSKRIFFCDKNKMITKN